MSMTTRLNSLRLTTKIDQHVYCGIKIGIELKTEMGVPRLNFIKYERNLCSIMSLLESLKMQIITLLFDVAALILGSFAAFYWYKSTTSELTRKEAKGSKHDKFKGGYLYWKGNREIDFFASLSKQAELNRTAALWTALSLVSVGLSTALGVLIESGFWLCRA
jgi:hypothetical protein